MRWTFTEDQGPDGLGQDSRDRNPVNLTWSNGSFLHHPFQNIVTVCFSPRALGCCPVLSVPLTYRICHLTSSHISLHLSFPWSPPPQALGSSFTTFLLMPERWLSSGELWATSCLRSSAVCLGRASSRVGREEMGGEARGRWHQTQEPDDIPVHILGRRCPQ